MSDVTVDDKDITLLALALGLMAVNIVLLIVILVFQLGQTDKVDVVYNAECTYRQNLQQQVTDTEHYLALHPDGAPSLGITAAQLQSTLAREKAAVDSLSTLNCSNQKGFSWIRLLPL